MIRCQACGTNNLESSQFCDECGSTLNAREQNSGGQPEGNSGFQTQFSDAPVFQSANVTSVGIPIIIEDQPTAAEKEEKPLEGEGRDLKKGVQATLLIERGGSVGTEFTLSADESYIGRWDADNGIFPDVDLDAHDPEAKVSRRHARIKRDEDGRFVIEDLGSTNGTFVNRGRRLIPGSPHLLNDGDEIIVGKTFLRFFVKE